MAADTSEAELALVEAETSLAARLAEDELELRERLRIEPMALEEEFVRCPSDIAYMAAKHARAIGEHLHAKSRAKRLRGLLLLEARAKLHSAGAKTTVGEVEAQVDCDARWITIKGAEDNAEALREKSKGDMLAIVAKKDMLVQMGANSRAEMERDPVIRDRMRGARMIGG